MNQVEDKYLNKILEHFSQERKPYQFHTIHAGYINDTHLVSDNDVPKFILQRINHNVFKDIKGLMSNIDLALKQLDDPEYAKIALVKTRTKDTFYEDNGYWRLMTYINQSTAHNTTEDPKIAFEAGRIIGKFHQLLGTSPIEKYVDTIPKFHDMDLRFTQLQKAITGADAEKRNTAASAIHFTSVMYPELQRLIRAKLPFRICHNDTKLNNILFSKTTNKALCLIDLDTLMKGHFYFDFGDAIRTIVNPANEDEKDLNKITFDRSLFLAFIEGLQTQGPFLTKIEIDHLALGVVFMPFIHGLRALTDYLENNKYYKASYQNQNLDRSISLFDFTQKAWEEVDFMQTMIQKELIPTHP